MTSQSNRTPVHHVPVDELYRLAEADAHVQDGRRILWGINPDRYHQDPDYRATVEDMHARLMPRASLSDMHALIDETTGAHALRSTSWYDPATGHFLGGQVRVWHEVALPDAEVLP